MSGSIPIWGSRNKGKRPEFITVYSHYPEQCDHQSFGGFVRSYTRDQRSSKEWNLWRNFSRKPLYRINIRPKVSS